jgi:RNA polymerase sigma-70 factor (ECF subfamily)
MTEPFDPEDHAAFIRRVRAGDEAAAAELVRRYEAEVRLEIRTRLRLRDPRLRRVFDSMDICQSVLASFLLHAAAGAYDLEQPDQLVRLLVGMARNKLSEHMQYHQRQRRDVRRLQSGEPEEVEHTAQTGTPSQVIAGRELLQEFRRRLTEEERRVADLRAQGHDWTSIAAELGGTPDGRRKQLRRAVERVEQELGLKQTSDGGE